MGARAPFLIIYFLKKMELGTRSIQGQTLRPRDKRRAAPREMTGGLLVTALKSFDFSGSPDAVYDLGNRSAASKRD